MYCKGKRYTIETFSIDRILNKKHFHEKIMQKMCTRNQAPSENLCKPIHDIINYSNFNCSFLSSNCGKEGKNYKNLNISRTF